MFARGTAWSSWRRYALLKIPSPTGQGPVPIPGQSPMAGLGPHIGQGIRIRPHNRSQHPCYKFPPSNFITCGQMQINAQGSTDLSVFVPACRTSLWLCIPISWHMLSVRTVSPLDCLAFCLLHCCAVHVSFFVCFTNPLSWALVFTHPHP